MTSGRPDWLNSRDFWSNHDADFCANSVMRPRRLGLLLLLIVTTTTGCLTPVSFEQDSDWRWRQAAPGHRPINSKDPDRRDR